MKLINFCFKSYGLISIFKIITISFALNEEGLYKRLKNELFENRNYDRTTIPLKNHSHALNVSISYTLIHIKSLDIINQILTIEGWTTFQWHDDYLMWDKSQFDNINVLRVSSNEVFIPDIMLYNMADYSETDENLQKTNILVYSNGLIMWVPPGTQRILCRLNLKNWPFDEHICYLKFGSWTYDGYAMDIRPSVNNSGSGTTNKGVSLEDFWENPEWEVIYTNVTRNEKYYNCCTEPYPDVTFFLKIKRKASLYHYTIFIPAIVAIILSVISFWLPIRATVRFVLNGFSLLLLTLLLLYLGMKLGFDSFGIPYAIRNLSLTNLLIGLSLIWTTIGYNLSLLKCRIPGFASKIATPMIRVFYTNTEHETVQLTQADDSQNEKRTSEPSFEDLITVVDKIVFLVFIIALCLVLI